MLWGPLVLVVGTERDEVALLLEVKQQVPELTRLDELLHELVAQIVAGRGRSSQVDQRFVYKPVAQLVVAPVHFSISFFDQRHPEFARSALRKQRRALGVAGDEVVDGDHLPLSVFAQLNPVEAEVVHRLGNKQPFNQGRPFAEHRERRKKPLVAQEAWLDVGGLEPF